MKSGTTVYVDLLRQSSRASTGFVGTACIDDQSTVLFASFFVFLRYLMVTNDSVRQNWCWLDTKLDTLLAEYDPRPSRSRREHTLDKLRKALPWPQDALQVASGCDGCGDEGWESDTRDEEHVRGEADSFNHIGDDGGRHEDDVSDDGYYADEFAGDDQRDICPEAGWGEGGEQPTSHTGGQHEENGANAVDYRAGAGGSRGVVDYPNFGHDTGYGDGGTSSALGKGDAQRPSAGSGGMASTENCEDANGGGGGTEEVTPESPPKPRQVGGGDDDGKICAVTLTARANDEVGAREDQGQAGVMATEGPTKRPTTGQRKARRKANTASVNCQN